MKLIKSYARKSDATKLANKLNLETKGHTVSEDAETGEWAVLLKPAKKKAKKKAAVKKAAKKKDVEAKDVNPLAGKSSIDSPVSRVWEICDEFYKQAQAKDLKLSRKKVIDFCVSQGIAFYTARTQYQSWKTAQGI